MLTPSEAVFGFAGWLTARKESITIGSTHPADIMAELADQFCQSNEFDPPRDRWTDELKVPQTTSKANES